MVKTPPKKVFWGGFGGLNPFSGGTWTLRDIWTFAEMLASNFSVNSAIPLWPEFPTKIKLFRVLHECFLD